MTELKGRVRDYAWLVRVASAGPIVYCLFSSFNDVALISTWAEGPRHGLWALAAAVCYLPLLIRHVWYAVHAVHPPAGLWTLAVMAVVIIGAVPLAGDTWLRTFGWLAVSAGIVLRPPWSKPVVAALLVLPLMLAVVRIEDPGDAWWVGIQPLFRALTLSALVWLAAGVRQLQSARLMLADKAVAQERSRIDDDLERTLGVALEWIVTRGDRAVARVGTNHATLERELRDLVDGSRQTLAEARQMIRGYQQVSLQAELDTAASLLTAAGIDTKVGHFSGRLAPDIDRSTRDALRAATAQMLRDGTVRSCSISVTRDGVLRFDVTADGKEERPAGIGAR